MRILILGGTAWLGRETARQAVAAGHEVWCLARGTSGEPPEGVHFRSADRADPSAYAGLPSFDAAIEVSWEPEFVRQAVGAVDAEHWVYVSSISAYADAGDPDSVSRGTAAALLEPLGPGVPASLETYGSAKVACEEAIGVTPSQCLLRAGLIAGPGDPTGRFSAWPWRVAAVAERPEVLTPPLSIPVQVIDVRDLAVWMLHCAEARVQGVFDAVGEISTLAAVVDEAARLAGVTPHLIERSSDELLGLEVRPWSGPGSLPLWAGADGTGFLRRSPEQALTEGLRLRPLSETIDAILTSDRPGADAPGLRPDHERELIHRLST